MTDSNKPMSEVDDTEQRGATRFYVDCEFDGHAGVLLSIAVVHQNGGSLYVRTTEKACDPWVIANVMPYMEGNLPPVTLACVSVDRVGHELRSFVRGRSLNPIIVADSPVDIARFCQAVATGDDGGYYPFFAESMSCEVHDVDCYPTTLPGAVQHNAWWDAMALRERLRV